MDGNEGAGERPFAEQVLEQVGDAERQAEQVGDAERKVERVRRLGTLAEVFREQHDPGEARQAADQDAGADRSCRHAWVRAWKCVRVSLGVLADLLDLAVAIGRQPIEITAVLLLDPLDFLRIDRRELL